MSGRPGRRRGFTLVELVVASAISAILLMSLGGVVMLSASAVPRMNERARTREDVAAFMSDLRLELQAAERIENIAANALQFRIPDRDGDGQPEPILYRFNSGSEPGVLRGTGVDDLVSVLPVTRVRFAAERSVRTERVPGASVEDSADTLLAEFDAGSWTAASNPITIHEVAINAESWAGQMLEPTAPADAVAWRPTRLDVPISNRNGNGDTIGVELRRSLGLQPTGPGGVLRSETIAIANNKSNAKNWREVSVEAPDATDGLDAHLLVPRGESLAMVMGSSRAVATLPHAVLTWAAPGDASPSPVHGRAVSLDGGGSWTRYGEQAMEYRLHGRWVRRGADVLALDHVFLEAVHVYLEMDGQAVYGGRIDLPARPRLDAGRWSFDLVDGKVTSSGDWLSLVPASGAAYSAAGVDRLQTPVITAFDFDSDQDEAEAVLEIRADRAADQGGYLPIQVRYEQVTAQERRVEIRTVNAMGEWQVVSWWTEADSSAVLSGRIVVFPGEQLVSVELAGEYRGTFAVERVASGAFASIALQTGTVEPSLVRLEIVRPRPLP